MGFLSFEGLQNGLPAVARSRNFNGPPSCLNDRNYGGQPSLAAVLRAKAGGRRRTTFRDSEHRNWRN